MTGIYKRELRSYFYSMIGYVFIGVQSEHGLSVFFLCSFRGIVYLIDCHSCFDYEEFFGGEAQQD